MTTSLEQIQAVMAGGGPDLELGKMLDMRLVEATHGSVAFEMEAGEKHNNPMGTVHGGVLTTLADSAMGLSVATMLDPGDSFTTLELKINFLRPVWKGLLRAAGRVTHAGKSVALVECDVHDAQGRLVAKATSTCMVLRGEKAAGRQMELRAAGDPAAAA